MQGKKVFADEKVLLFSLSAHVPEHNLYRRLQQQLHMDFLYELTLPYYGQCGQQSIDPVVFFKLGLIVDLQQKSGQKIKRLNIADITNLPFVRVSDNPNWNAVFPGCTRFP